MSFITRCPACHTAFKVVQDQLKISDGWVRCGQCQHIFDATLDLEPWWPGLDQVPKGGAQPQTENPAASAPVVVPPSAPPAPTERATSQPHTDLPDPPAAAEHADLEPEPGGVWTRASAADVWRTPTSAAEPSAQPLPEPLPEPSPEPLERHEAAQQGPAQAGAEPEAPLALPQEAAAPVPAATPAPSSEPPPLPTFVRQAQRRAWWQRPAVRLGLGVCCLLLALALALQVAQRWHAALARQLPAAQPVLESLCQTLECAVPELDAASAVVIDSSVLLRRAPGLYSFQVVLRNQSALEVPSPAIELTLTDIHDQVLVRRVLLPQEWPRPRATLAAGVQWSLQFELGFEGVPERVMTGYRAILFYP